MNRRYPPPRALLAAAGAAWALALAPTPSPAGAARPQAAEITAEPYIGVSVRDTADGPVVAWVYPGPAGGEGYTSQIGIQRGDNIDALHRGATANDETRVPIASASAFNDFVATLSPGEMLSIEARRSPEAQPNASIPKGGPGGETTTYSIRVADKDDWTGTIGRGLGERSLPAPREGEFEPLILAMAAEAGVRDAEGGLDELLPYLARVQDTQLDPNSLACVVNAFRRPLSVDALERDIAVLARGAAPGSHQHIKALIAHALDLPRYDGEALDRALESVDLPRLRDDLRGLVAWGRSNVSVGGPDAASQIRAIRDTEGRVAPFLAFILHASDTVLEWEAIGRVYADAEPLAEIPEDLRHAITGTVLHIERFDNGVIGVVGGQGDNTYDVSVVADVYDIGGDDSYRFGTNDASRAVGAHYIIDLAGNDTYEATTDFAGPAVGIMGLAMVDDRAGNDTYRSADQFSIGAGLFGVGLLIDRAGDDIYENLGPDSGWSMGVGYYGAGLVIDGAGDDTYHGEQLTQGVGGPRGLGAIIDGDGADSYKANGPSFGSVYGTEGVYKGFSQGFGIGVRSYAAGGLGAIYDLAGDDRYEAGEFSQGCAYYFALGLLHDAEGNDTYVGNRYGQASAAHQAIGLLIDEAGDDSYWSMTAASQAGVWDQSIAVLVDRAGNDRYEADGLAQGSASMQALGVLLDLGGDDDYAADGTSQQGRSGGNTYHYDADMLFSFSALIDLGGGADAYSSGRENGRTLPTGSRNAESPGASDLHGLFADR